MTVGMAAGLVSALIGLAGCEKVVEFKVDEVTPYVVLVSKPEADSMVRIKLSHSRFFLDGHSFRTIRNADVRLYATGRQTNRLSADDGEYFFDCLPQAGDTLDLQVLVPGYPMVQAGTRVPAEPDVEVLETAYDSLSQTCQVKVRIHDPQGKNYYRISFDGCDPQYQDGVLYFRLTSDFPMNTLRFDDNDVLRTSELPMLSGVFEKYGVNLLLRPFHLFGNEELMHTLEVRFDRMEAIDSFLLELQGFECVALAEKVPFMRLMGSMNDPYYGTVSGRNWKWHLDMINADSAWMIQTGKPYIKVAVVDNFIWEGHPDLQIDSANLCTVSYSRIDGYQYKVGTASPPSTIARKTAAATI